MEVYVQRTAGVAGLSFDIWFIHDDLIGGEPRTVGHFAPSDDGGPARLWWTEVQEGVAQEPTLRLGAQEIEMLRAGLDEYGPVSNADHAFLHDAIKVRERLLTLVEQRWKDDPSG